MPNPTYKDIPLDRVPADFWDCYSRDPHTRCWNWTANIHFDGYPRTYFAGQAFAAHRVAYTLIVGRIPDGLTLDHLCRNRRCINPRHLEPVTVLENIARAPYSWGDGFCINGHEIAVVGTHKHGSKRTCAQCGRDRVRRYALRKQEAI